jgi:hypothetical protein
MRRKRIKPGQLVDVRLTPLERNLIVERTFIDGEMEARLRGATARGSNLVVQLTLDDVDDLAGHVAAEANHCSEPRVRRVLDAVYARLASIEDALTDQERPTETVVRSRNEGWVSVGIDHDTASVAVHAMRRWWRRMGHAAYPDTPALLITADAGGSTGPRVRVWKWELQQFATRAGLAITVCHFPPGTSTWNKIEHRLFSHIAMNWRGTPLVDLVTIVNLIGDTTTTAGLRVRSEIDRGHDPQGVVIRDDQMARLHVEPHTFHGDWNYTIRPVTRPH